MSACILIAADVPLPEYRAPRAYPIRIDVDAGTVEDGGADDNFSLLAFADAEAYTGRAYAVSLEWIETEGRARRVADYMKRVLRRTDTVELRHVWLTDYVEFDERPVLRRTRITAAELTAEHILSLARTELWDKPDRRNPGRPSHHCLIVTRE